MVAATSLQTNACLPPFSPAWRSPRRAAAVSSGLRSQASSWRLRSARFCRSSRSPRAACCRPWWSRHCCASARCLCSPPRSWRACAALYLLARSMSAMQAIAAGPLAEASLPHELARHVVDAVALLLPALDRVTRTEWLLYGAPEARGYAMSLASLLVYAALLAAAGVFDFERRAA